MPIVGINNYFFFHLMMGMIRKNGTHIINLSALTLSSGTEHIYAYDHRVFLQNPKRIASQLFEQIVHCILLNCN